METKVWYKSKTVLLNMIAGLCLAVSPAIPGGKIVSDWIAANGVLVGSIWSGLNIILRLVSKDKIVLMD